MKHFLTVVTGFVFVALLGLFAVALCGAALEGDLYAITLLISEVALVVYPMVTDERKQPKWKSQLWTWLIFIWMAGTIIWLANTLTLI